jgi:hypothetical protein
MFQESLFEYDDALPSFVSFDNKPTISSYFEGKSVVKQNAFYCKVGAGAKTEIRTTVVGDSVLVYRNLNKPSFFSIKQSTGAYKGKVTGYANSIVIKNPDFKLSEASRKRCLSQNSRNVHCYLTGQFISAFEGDVNLSSITDFERVSYSPYVGGYFFTLERDGTGQLIKDSIKPFNNACDYTHAIINGADVLLCNL